MFQYLRKLLLISIFFGKSLAEDPSPCGDWTAFKDEKCFKVLDSVASEAIAETICKGKGDGSNLAIIRTSEEQEFIEKYLKESKIADNVWIGIKKTNNSFKGFDELDIKYTNWAKDRPLKGSIDLNCVEISVDESNFGKWMDDKCQKKNVVLCQKIQTWSLSRLQEILLEKTREFKSELDSQKAEMAVLNYKMIPAQQKLIDQQRSELDALKSKTIPEQQKQIDLLKANPVPIGFIYVQLSGQSEPNTLWPNTQWVNVSPKYSGLFFRTEGGQSSTFGQIQEQQTQSLEFYSNSCSKFTWWGYGTRLKVTDTVSSKCLPTGTDEGTGKYSGIMFKHDSEEIRPRNQAVRIWQRIK